MYEYKLRIAPPQPISSVSTYENGSNGSKMGYVRGISVVSIVNKMRNNRLRWFRNVIRKEETKAESYKNGYENEC